MGAATDQRKGIGTGLSATQVLESTALRTFVCFLGNLQSCDCVCSRLPRQHQLNPFSWRVVRVLALPVLNSPVSCEEIGIHSVQEDGQIE